MGIFRKKTVEDPDSAYRQFLAAKGFVPVGQTTEDDVFIAGFPKSGNTWMQHLLAGLVYGTNMKFIQNNLVRELVPDEEQIKYYKRYNPFMVFKTHHLPKERYRRVFYVVRDGRDALTSFYQMETGRGKNITLEEIVKKNTGLKCSWQDHVSQWMSNPYKAEICVVRYEDLLKDPVNELKKMAAFINRELPDELLKEIAYHCSFDSMRKKEENLLWEKSKEWKEGRYFIRKGETGDYKNHFSPGLEEYFINAAAKQMELFKYL